jgi:hypothetical protein
MRNIFENFPSHLLQDFTPLLHPMLTSPPFRIYTNQDVATSEFELHLNGVARMYQETANLHKFPMKKQGNFYTQWICYACGETQHVARQCPNQKVVNLDHVKKKGCSQCGEEGHQANQCTDNCPNCIDKHPTREYPSSNITCFLCESSTHVPANCHMNHLVSSISKIQLNNF